MILQRIAKAIREQNWFAVFLEFIIVILGVVIGFQVTAWNAERADRAIIAGQVGEVLADLQVDIDSLVETREAGLWRLAAAEYILTRMEGGDGLAPLYLVHGIELDRSLLPEIGPEDHPVLLARVNLVRGLTGQRTGYESLVNGGSLRLIEDTGMRAAIQRYYTGYEDLQNNLGIFRDIRAAAIPVLYRHGFSLFSEQDLSTVLQAARTDPEFFAYLQTGRELGLSQYALTMQRENEALALLEQVSEALRR